MSLLRSSLTLTLSNLAVRFGSYVYRILMGRLLSPYEFGLLNLALPLQFFVVVLASSGIAPSLARFIAERQAKGDLRGRDEIASSALLYYTLAGVLLGALFFALAPLAIDIFGEPSLVTTLRLSAIALPFGFALAALSGVFQGLRSFGTLAFVLSAQQGLRISFALLLVVLFSATANSAILGSTLGFVAAVLLACMLFRRLGISTAARSFGAFRGVFIFSIPVSLTSVAAFALAYVDILLLGVYLPPQEVGIYSAASPTARLGLAFASALTAALLPRVAALSAESDAAAIRAQVARSYRLLFPVLGAVTAAALLFAGPIITLLFGSAYAEAAGPFRILVLGSLFYGFFSVNSGIYQGLGRPAQPMKILGIAAVIDVLLNLLLIPHFGIMGAALASSLSLAFAGVASVVGIKLEMARLR
ncbi:flippase [Candidatus Pyrohabitans sp.]